MKINHTSLHALGWAIFLPIFLLSCGLFNGITMPGSPQEKVSMPTPAALTDGSPQVVKIYADQDGMYELETADLEDTGINLDAPPFPRLEYRGQPQPIWIDGEAGARKLRFYARASGSSYANENVYFLRPAESENDGKVEGDGKDAMSSEGMGDSQMPSLVVDSLPTGVYLAQRHFEENNIYNPKVEEGDHFLWASLPAPQSHSVDFELDALADGPGYLEIMVWASTEAPESPDHHWVVSVNGQQVLDESWDGKGRHNLKVVLPVGVLVEGANAIEIQAPGDTGVVADVVSLDWVRISYPRQFLPVNDRLDFINPGGRFPVDGFSGPVGVYDVTDPGAPVRVAAPDENIQVFEREPGRRYVLVGPNGYRRPARLSLAALDPDLRAAGIGADYVAVGPPDLLAPLAPLLDWRREQGLDVMAVPLDAVYDQFNGGLPEPEAIRSFMKYAAENWKPAPRFLLLVGDGSYDPRGYLTPPEANRLPVFLIPTAFGGQTASDVGYAELEGEFWPPDVHNSDDWETDLAVGRVPAQNEDHVKVLVKKTLAFEKSVLEGDLQGWRGRVLAIADGQNASFSADAQRFLDLFPSAYDTGLFAPEAGAADANRQIADRLEQGSQIVAYFGHGSIDMWGKDRLFSAQDVSMLNNRETPPVVIHMTCLTGLFTHPKVESLAESMLWRAEGGAVAVLAPTSLTLPSDQSFLSDALVKSMLENPHAALGELLMVARREIPGTNQGAQDVLRTFLLFGDPALELTLP